jgi:hypothetical protein
MNKYYLIHIVDDVWPELYGPYKSKKKRNQKALELRAKMGDPKDGLFKLTLFPDGILTADAYSGSFFPDEQ